MSRTIIGPETRVAGGLSGKDELVVEGVVDGPVTGEAAVTLAAGATVNGEVRGREVVIAGVHKHNVYGSATVRLLATAELTGDIHAPRIAVDEGAVFEGQVRMGRAAAPAQPDRRASMSPMRDSAPSPSPTSVNTVHTATTPREIPSLPPLGKKTAMRRKA